MDIRELIEMLAPKPLGDGWMPNADGVYTSKTLPDGRAVDVIALTYGRARLCITSPHSRLIYDNGY